MTIEDLFERDFSVKNYLIFSAVQPLEGCMAVCMAELVLIQTTDALKWDGRGSAGQMEQRQPDKHRERPR